MDRFRRFVEDMLEDTRPDGLEHMAFHFTRNVIEDGQDMSAFLADNQQHTKPELQEAFAVLLKKWQQLKGTAGGEAHRGAHLLGDAS